MKKLNKKIRSLGVFLATAVLAGCKMPLLHPAGYVATQERTLILTCVFVMLCIVIPVMIAVVVFAFKFRASREADYLPDWGHSNKIEMFMWGIPIIVVIILASLTATYTYHLEPSGALPSSAVNNEKPLQIDAVALDWKWLFIYPEYGVATTNEIYAPVKRQVFLQLSAESSINAFWVPTLGTILYAMPQMNSKLHLVANTTGVFRGMSANFSGDGFANMEFRWHSVSQADFDSWIAKIKGSNANLDRSAYLGLAKTPAIEDIARKEEDKKVHYYSQVDPELYYKIVNGCVQDGKVCNERLMWRDAASSLWGHLCSVFNADYVQK